MRLSYIHPDEPFLPSNVDWSQAKLVRRKRLCSSDKVSAPELVGWWEQTQWTYTWSYLETLFRNYIEQYASEMSTFWSFGLKVEIQWRWDQKKWWLILHSKVEWRKQEVSLEISASEASALLFAKESWVNTRMPYVKQLKIAISIVNTKMNIVKYLWRHSGLYHTNQSQSNLYVHHAHEYHWLQSMWARDSAAFILRVRDSIDWTIDPEDRL